MNTGCFRVNGNIFEPVFYNYSIYCVVEAFSATENSSILIKGGFPESVMSGFQMAREESPIFNYTQVWCALPGDPEASFCLGLLPAGEVPENGKVDVEKEHSWRHWEGHWKQRSQQQLGREGGAAFIDNRTDSWGAIVTKELGLLADKTRPSTAFSSFSKLLLTNFIARLASWAPVGCYCHQRIAGGSGT